MDLTDLIGVLAIGLAGGMLGGLVGVGGGVLFVPGLVLFLDFSQLHAESTSLLAIVFVGAVGSWRQGIYGNLRARDGVALGLLSPVGVVAGAVLANAVSERALELSFAALQVAIAVQLVRRAVAPNASREPSNG